MHRTTISFSERLFRKAKLKATSEGVTVSQVLRNLLERWIRGEVGLGKEPLPEDRAKRALASFGMWRDRDPDDFLEESRTGLERRDKELDDARLDSR